MDHCPRFQTKHLGPVHLKSLSVKCTDCGAFTCNFRVRQKERLKHSLNYRASSRPAWAPGDPRKMEGRKNKDRRYHIYQQMDRCSETQLTKRNKKGTSWSFMKTQQAMALRCPWGMGRGPSGGSLEAEFSSRLPGPPSTANRCGGSMLQLCSTGTLWVKL